MKLFKRKMTKKQKTAINALADGIECGAKLRPQCRAGLMRIVDEDQNEKTGMFGSCALGAAYECALIKKGIKIDREVIYAIIRMSFDDILKEYGVTNRVGLNYIEVETDLGDMRRVADQDADVSALIWRLNDWMNWTREQIAQF